MEANMTSDRRVVRGARLFCRCGEVIGYLEVFDVEEDRRSRRNKHMELACSTFDNAWIIHEYDVSTSSRDRTLLREQLEEFTPRRDRELIDSANEQARYGTPSSLEDPGPFKLRDPQYQDYYAVWRLHYTKNFLEKAIETWW